ncbi:XrtA/PEP-CTERM system TPR-repeat protein PrsT [Pseudoduganella sp. UC29_106]|uniref:XrtA/PEP-CTERM system TPR-repeat protein PrsT n=1 Tax=Pseudoduganella sp. UC29_106 TaxID=3374553 RepID=UPI0037569E53
MPRRFSKLAASATVIATCQLLAAGLTGCHSQTSDGLLAEAKQFQQKDNDKAALIQLKNAAAKSPDNAEIRFQLAALHNKMADGASAEKEVRKAIAISKDRTRAAPDLAIALLLQGKPQRVIDETAPDAANGGAALLNARGEAYFALNDIERARESYKQALAADAGNAHAFIGLAKIAARNKDLENAVSLTDQAITANPKEPAAWSHKGMLLRMQRKFDDAIAAFSQAIAINPSVPGPYLERAEDEMELKKYDAVKADIAAARKIAPDTVQVVFTQAKFDLVQGNFAAAREGVQKVLAVAPDHLPSSLLAGMVELKLGATEAAEQHLKKFVDNFPEHAGARKLLAKAMLKNGRPGEAMVILGPLLKSGGEDPQLLELAGEALLQGKDYRNAAQFFEKASGLVPESAALHTSIAMSKLGMGNSAEAVAELETAVRLNPKQTEAAFLLVKTEMQLKHYDKAMATVQKLEQAQPNNAEILNLKGGLYIAQRDKANARASFEKSAAAQSDYFVPITNLVGMDKAEGKLDVAKKRYESFLAKNKKHFGAMWGLAEIEAEQGNAAMATHWLERASADNPQALPPAIKLGYHYLENKENQKALTLLRKFAAANPSNPELLDALGLAQMANNDNAGALDSYGKLVSLRPRSVTSHLRLAAAHVAAKNYAAATEDLKRAEAVDPGAFSAHTGLIEIAMRQQKWGEALNMVRDLQKKAGNSPVGYVLEGDLFMRQNQAANAIPAYEKAYALNKAPDSLIRIADAMKLAGKWKDAEVRLAQWRQTNPNDAMIPLYQSQQYSNDKQYKPAAEALRTVLKLRPDNQVALNNLAWVYQQDKDPRALETAEHAAKIAPNNPVIMDTLGWMLVEQGDLKRGLPMLQKAAGLAPEAKDIRYHMAIALQKSGDKAGARKELEKLFADRKPFPEADQAKALLKVL